MSGYILKRGLVRGNRTIFWSIWAIAFLPVIAAVVMYFGQIGVPDGRTHHGELVEYGTQYSDIGLPDPGDPARWQVVLSSSEAVSPAVHSARVLRIFIQL